MFKRILMFESVTSRRQTFVYFYAYFVLGAIISSLGPTLHYLSTQAQVGVSQIGLLFSARSFGYLIGSLLFGRLYDRVSGHRILMFIFIASALITVSIPWLPSLGFMLVFIFFTGVMLGGVDVGSNTLLAWVHGHKSGPFLTAMFFFAGLGSIFSPLIVSFFDRVPYGGVFSYLIIGLLLIPGIILAWRSPSPKIRSRTVEESAAPLPIFSFVAFAILFLLYVGAEVSFGGWIHTFITSSALGDMRTASLFNTAFWVAITVGRLLMIPLAIKFTPRRLVLACLLGAIGSISLVLIFPGSITAAWIMILGVGLSIASLFPITFAITERMIQITGTRNGILWAVGSAGGIILPWFVGMEISNGANAFPKVLLLSWGFALLVFLAILTYRRLSKSIVSSEDHIQYLP